MSTSNPAPILNAFGVNQTQVTVKATDGDCSVWVLTPPGEGQWPGVIFYTDIFGIRPAMIQMASHIASHGYVVAMADLFYRHGAYGPYDPKELFKGDFRAVVGPMAATTNNHKAADDTVAVLKYLDSRTDVKGKKIGTVGFCLGGGMALTAAAWFPDRVAAVGSFHGGNLASDLPVSPHLQLPKVRAELLIAGADEDQSYPPEMKKRLEEALDAAGVKYVSKTYEGKKHGWMKPDMPVFDAEAADRGWDELFELYGRTLG